MLGNDLRPPGDQPWTRGQKIALLLIALVLVGMVTVAAFVPQHLAP